MDISSYTAASTIPKKLLTNLLVLNDIRTHSIRPVHIQLNPTNKCPLNCSFCSCKNRDKSAVMPIKEARALLDKFKKLGTKAVTITGGGDPLAYPDLKELLEYIRALDMEVGLVTNGILFGTIQKTILSGLKWCRVSVSDEQLLPRFMLETVKVNPEVEWAFSYVLNGSNIQNLVNCINFANNHNFTHIRLVDNILTDTSNMGDVEDAIHKMGIDDKLVIYQGRKKHSYGHKRCFISLLKPNIDPEGKMLPCCGIQYAFENPAYDFDKEAVMNRDNSLEEIYEKQMYFDGSNCVKCYYSDYNEIMNILWDGDKIQHQRFI